MIGKTHSQIRMNHLDRGIEIEKYDVPSRSSRLVFIRGGKKERVKSILENDVAKYISKSMYIQYGENIRGTPVDLQMLKNSYFIMVEDKEPDEELAAYFGLETSAKMVRKTQAYIYKNEDGDLLYFRNPFYEGDILPSLKDEYQTLMEEGAFFERGGNLYEYPLYNEKFMKIFESLLYTPFNLAFVSEEFDDQMTKLVGLISSIDGGISTIKNARNLI